MNKGEYLPLVIVYYPHTNPFFYKKNIFNLLYNRILMPARWLAFTKENILSAWEAVGIIPFNPRQAIGKVK